MNCSVTSYEVQLIFTCHTAQGVPVSVAQSFVDVSTADTECARPLPRAAQYAENPCLARCAKAHQFFVDR